MFGFKLKFPFRITGISTLWGGLSWEYCDSSKESKGKEITLDSNSKIFVFISSKCQPEKYKNIRAVLKQQLEDTGIFSVYIFEEAGASSTSPQNKYLTQLIRSDVCIFLIDNKDGITEGVQQEIDVALKHEKGVSRVLCNIEPSWLADDFPTIKVLGEGLYCKKLDIFHVRPRLVIENSNCLSSLAEGRREEQIKGWGPKKYSFTQLILIAMSSIFFYCWRKYKASCNK